VQGEMSNDQSRVPGAMTLGVVVLASAMLIPGCLTFEDTGEFRGGQVSAGVCTFPDAPTDFQRQLRDMPADSWLEVADTKMQDVCPRDGNLYGTKGCSAVINDRGGGALDRRGNRMIVWGGGGPQYYGNEVYAFDLETGTWGLLVEATSSAVDDQSSDPLENGEPASRETRDGLEVIEDGARLFAFGGTSDGHTHDTTWTLDLGSAEWTAHDEGPGFDLGQHHAAAWDPVTRRVYVRAHDALHSYDPSRDLWETVLEFGTPPVWPRYFNPKAQTATIDPTRRLLWVVGRDNVLVWDIDLESMVTDDWVTEGGGEYINFTENPTDRARYPDQVFESGGGEVYYDQAPGIDYDHVADALVAYTGERAPWILDLESKTWAEGAPDGPVNQDEEGIYGRWRYIPAYNVFIMVADVDQNVFFYRNETCP